MELKSLQSYLKKVHAFDSTCCSFLIVSCIFRDTKFVIISLIFVVLVLLLLVDDFVALDPLLTFQPLKRLLILLILIAFLLFNEISKPKLNS